MIKEFGGSCCCLGPQAQLCSTGRCWLELALDRLCYRGCFGAYATSSLRMTLYKSTSYGQRSLTLLKLLVRLLNTLDAFSVSIGYRLANVSDSTTTEFHPCEGGGNETVPTMFLEEGATCDDQFLRFFGEPEVLLTAKNGSYMIMVSADNNARGLASRIVWTCFGIRYHSSTLTRVVWL